MIHPTTRWPEDPLRCPDVLAVCIVRPDGSAATNAPLSCTVNRRSFSSSASFQPSYNPSFYDNRYGQQPIISPYFAQNTYSHFPPTYGIKRPVSIQPVNYFQSQVKPRNVATGSGDAGRDAYIMSRSSQPLRFDGATKNTNQSAKRTVLGARPGYKVGDGQSSSSVEDSKEMR